MQDKKSILFTIPNFITAGSGQVVINIVKNLDRDRFNPAVCVLKKGGKKDRQIEDLAVPFLETPFTVPARPYHNLFWRTRKAAQEFKAHRFDLWHSFHYSDDYTEPLIARWAGTGAWIYTKTQMNWHRRSWYLRTLLASRVIALNTRMMKEFFASIFFRLKARHIPIGIDQNAFHPETPPRFQLRQRYALPPRTIVITCVADLLPVKGQKILIQALSQVPDGVLFLAGRPLDEGYGNSLHELVQGLGLANRVHFLGGIDDVPALLVEADIFILPSLREGLGVALIEGMACGKACVATDIPGPRDILDHGRCGMLVPPGNADAMAAALNRLSSLPSLREMLGKAARERVIQNYTIEKEVRSLEALYEELLTGNKY
jgi:glycosyltransferase involved in cell wall biosynthesis